MNEALHERLTMSYTDKATNFQTSMIRSEPPAVAVG